MADIEKILEFLREIHKIKSDNYDNSISVPYGLNDKYANFINTTEEWRHYLDYKFKFFMLPDRADNTIDQFISMMTERGKSYLREFIDDWKRREKDERIALQYRLAQIMPYEVRRRWYYDEIDECDEWIRNAQKEINEWVDTALEKKWSVIVEEIWKKIDKVPYMSLREDYILAEVCKRGLQPHIREINEIHSYLAQDPSNLCKGGSIIEKCQEVLDDIEQHFKQSTKIDDNMNPNESDFLVTLSIELTRAIYEENFDETALITRFLQNIKDYFTCEVCDYLDVSEDRQKIVWRTATVNHKSLSDKYRQLIESGKEEEWRKEILNRESYEEGFGISGSIMLLKEKTGRNIWFHVGSNDVENDPRQSKDHKHAYEEDMYPGVLKGGLIRNFWIFPIYRFSTLVGAFRVVNKLDASGKLKNGGWDYPSRLKLALIADWFSGFLEAVQRQIQSKEDFKALWLFSKGIEELQDKLKLDWIDKNVLAACLRHLRTVKLRKIEKRHLGCCLIITKNPGMRVLPKFDSYPLLDIDYGSTAPLFQGLEQYHDPVDPLKGAFVFDDKGLFRRVVKLEYIDDDTQIHKGINSLMQLTKKYPKSVCFVLPRDARNIIVYHSGFEAAEIRVSEIAGEYQFRYPEDIKDIIRAAAPKCESIITDMVCDTALELSNEGEGGIIILGEVPFEKLGLSRHLNIKPNQKIQDIGQDFLTEFVKLDGASFVQQDGVIVHVNTTVSTPFYNEPRKIFMERGARHEIGEKLSNIASGSLVIIISENGGISLVKNGRIVIHEGKEAENL